ncbi:hypothetical protein MRS44_013185 [Fusarium solani]|uniref:uncharacterized protein n=1 Tax=Fusarium solani TaxID=169388 RepID=UPI0032C4346D|nr:hypothetical protein MRS44_013185 [Fusarium solani]
MLLVMDAATFHKTEGIKKKLKDNGVSLALIPPGCTSLLQPLDTAINAPFKQWLQEATDEYVERIEKEKGEDFKCIRSDGTEDWLIRIKDIPSDQIDFTGWEEAEEIIVNDEDPVDNLYDDEELLAADDDELLLRTRYHEEAVKKLQERLKKKGTQSLRKEGRSDPTTARSSSLAKITRRRYDIRYPIRLEESAGSEVLSTSSACQKKAVPSCHSRSFPNLESIFLHQTSQ